MQISVASANFAVAALEKLRKVPRQSFKPSSEACKKPKGVAKTSLARSAERIHLKPFTSHDSLITYYIYIFLILCEVIFYSISSYFVSFMAFKHFKAKVSLAPRVWRSFFNFRLLPHRSDVQLHRARQRHRLLQATADGPRSLQHLAGTS